MKAIITILSVLSVCAVWGADLPRTVDDDAKPSAVRAGSDPSLGLTNSTPSLPDYTNSVPGYTNSVPFNGLPPGNFPGSRTNWSGARTNWPGVSTNRDSMPK